MFRFSVGRVLTTRAHVATFLKGAPPVPSSAAKVIDAELKGQLLRQATTAGVGLSKATAPRTLFFPPAEDGVAGENAPAEVVAAVTAGTAEPGQVREAIADGTRAAAGVLKDRRAAAIDASTASATLDDHEIAVDASVSPREAAEGAYLALHKFTLKTGIKVKVDAKEADVAEVRARTRDGMGPKVAPIGLESASSEREWFVGRVLAEGQNIARRLSESPANQLTPEGFAAEVDIDMIGLRGVEVTTRDREWLEENRFHAMLAVGRGSAQEPKLVEVKYNGDPDGPVSLALVGKGVTFDSGGISIKPSAGMGDMKADMGGAAVVMSVLNAIARLRLPVNIVAIAALCENMPSSDAQRPGDVIETRAGLSVEVDNTDAEGRLVLADALHYAVEAHRPETLIDVATLTGAMDVALGPACAGFFSESDELVRELIEAGKASGDPLWHMPVMDAHRRLIDCPIADIRNTGGRSAGACTAAAFLEKFVDSEACGRYAHVDMAGVMKGSSNKGTDIHGMTGRPTRALAQWCIDRFSVSQ